VADEAEFLGRDSEHLSVEERQALNLRLRDDVHLVLGRRLAVTMAGEAEARERLLQFSGLVGPSGKVANIAIFLNPWQQIAGGRPVVSA